MLLFVVDDVFNIKGRDVILTPGIVLDDTSQLIKNGTKIKLIKPDKTEIFTIITAVEMKTYKATNRHPIFIDNKLQKEEIPIGSEVWLFE